MRMRKQNVLLELSVEFGLAVIAFASELRRKEEFEIRGQILRSGTSIGANVHEAQYGSSKADFLHKLKIARKEANETWFWITLCERSIHLPAPNELKEKCRSLQKLLNAIITKTESNVRHGSREL